MGCRMSYCVQELWIPGTREDIGGMKDVYRMERVANAGDSSVVRVMCDAVRLGATG